MNNIKSKFNCQKHVLARCCVVLVLLAAVLGGVPCTMVEAAKDNVLPDRGESAAAGEGADSGSGASDGEGAGSGSGTAEDGQAVGKALVTTRFTAQERTVTLSVDIARDSQATSGRIKIHYPQELLSLREVKSGKLWDLEDTNIGLSEAGQDVLSYAWADTEKRSEEGNLITVTWEARDAANGKEVTVETEVAEMYSGDQLLDVEPDWIINRVWPSFVVAGGTGRSASAVRTGDESDVVGLSLLAMGAVLLMARLLRQKLNHEL
ncbi:MAG: hypothetical protein HFH36_08150 [Lachnospiraceae bacterium]|nr:hypothetical protein [Lachnospiraceae bacterium]